MEEEEQYVYLPDLTHDEVVEVLTRLLSHLNLKVVRIETPNYSELLIKEDN